MTDMQVFMTVIIASLVTLMTRLIAFLLFPAGKKAPAFITWLGKQLPRAVMMMLVIYCLKDVHFASAGGYIPAIVGVVVTAALHLWKRQMIISIAGGTAVYMVLLRVLGA